jgi:hypothetical protein
MMTAVLLAAHNFLVLDTSWKGLAGELSVCAASVCLRTNAVPKLLSEISFYCQDSRIAPPRPLQASFFTFHSNFR